MPTTLKDEAAIVHHRVWNRQVDRGHDLVGEQENVQVDGSRSPDGVASSSERLFNPMAQRQDARRRQRRADPRDGVEIRRLIGGPAHRLGLVETGDHRDLQTARRFDGAEGGGDVALTAAEI